MGTSRAEILFNGKTWEAAMKELNKPAQKFEIGSYDAQKRMASNQGREKYLKASAAKHRLNKTFGPNISMTITNMVIQDKDVASKGGKQSGYLVKLCARFSIQSDCGKVVRTHDIYYPTIIADGKKYDGDRSVGEKIQKSCIPYLYRHLLRALSVNPLGKGDG